jgi:dTDP-4-amino-4,6-dideoxygalactose transaminase
VFDTTNEDAIGAVTATLRNGRLLRYECADAEQSTTALFESAVAAHVGTRRAVAVNSAGSGLLLTLHACGLQPGDEVLVPAFTFVAVPSAVIRAGGTVRLVECTADYVIDCDDLERKITSRTRFLLLSYMRGRVPNLDRVLALCAEYHLTLVEDAAYALGVAWDGRAVGTFGRAGVLGFHTIVNSGEGAVVVTDDHDVADQVLVLAGCYDQNWRKHPDGVERSKQLQALVNAVPVYSMRMGNVIAALLGPQLARAEAIVEKVNGTASYLEELLSSSSTIQFPQVAARARHVAWTIQFALDGLDIDQRRRFVGATAARNIPMKIIGLDEDNSRCWWNWSFFEPDPCPRTREILERTVDFPLPTSLTRSQTFFLAQAVLDAVDEVVA